MVERKHPSDPFGNSGAEPKCARSSVVFCDDPAHVRAGFAIALRLMGVDMPMLDVEHRSLPKQKEQPDKSAPGQNAKNSN
jgi:hypothetical protein